LTGAHLAILFLVGVIASAINAVAGGGSLLSFPTLSTVFTLPLTVANANNSFLWPGAVGGALGFRNYFEKVKHHLEVLILPTIIGSITGAFLLVKTDPKDFDIIVPWLILLAATLLLIQPKVKQWVLKGGDRVLPVPVGILIQFLVSVYGGYFGAGMGIMMLAAFALYVEGNIHELNAIKNLLGLFINLTCSTVFIFQHLINPILAVVLSVGSVVGGFLGAHYSQKVQPDKLRTLIAVYGVGMAVYYFAKAHHWI